MASIINKSFNQDVIVRHGNGRPRKTWNDGNQDHLKPWNVIKEWCGQGHRRKWREKMLQKRPLLVSRKEDVKVNKEVQA